MTDEPAVVAAPETAAPLTQEPAAPATQPVEPRPEPADAGQPDDPGASDADPGDSPADDSRPKKKGGFQKRIEELTAEKYQERLKREAVERERDDLRRKLDPKPLTEPPSKPTLEQHQTIDDYQKAMDRYAEDVQEWGKQQGLKQAETQRQQQTEADKAIATKAAINAREDAARQKYADYDRVVDAVGAQIMGDPVLSQYVVDSESSADVAYHLAKNPHKLADLAAMSPLNKVRELIRLEERLKAPPPPKPVTQAPDPIKPVGARETAVKTLADLAKADDAAAYIKKANQARRKT